MANIETKPETTTTSAQGTEGQGQQSLDDLNAEFAKLADGLAELKKKLRDITHQSPKFSDPSANKSQGS